MSVPKRHPLVDCDLEEAALWYAARNARIAERFVDACEEAIREIGREPLRHRERFEGVRRANLTGFPYGVFYRIHRPHLTSFAHRPPYAALVAGVAGPLSTRITAE